MEWCDTHEQFVEDAPHGPRVHRIVVEFSFEDLGRGVERCANDGQLGLVRLKNRGEAEIRYFNLEVN